MTDQADTLTNALVTVSAFADKFWPELAALAVAAVGLWALRRKPARRRTASPPPQQDALTELAELEAHFDAYAARIDRLYLREEHPQP